MTVTNEIDAARLVTKANVYFDGQCISHSITLSDGSRKSIGVILPSSLTFNTATPEVMEGVSGACRVRLAGETEWKTYEAGASFAVPGQSHFDIEVSDAPYHYICHFA
jgi:purine/pyrimidine-nucleoside phosphorylase